jgi:lipopolysaccharide export system protein LptC
MANLPNNPGPNAPRPDPAPLAAPSDRLRLLATTRKGRAAYTPFYSRQVRRLRVVLPIVGVIIIAAVLLWPKIQAQFNHPTETSADERRARMINGRFVGSDAHGRPYTVTYESAEQPPGGGPVQMVNPIAELTSQNGHWLAIKADKGRYDQAAGLIDLSGHVELFHDDGYRFTTEVAHVEFNKNMAWGDRAVQGRGPKGEITARGFRVLNKGDSIVFTGPAKLLLRPDAAQLPEPDDEAEQ